MIDISDKLGIIDLFSKKLFAAISSSDYGCDSCICEDSCEHKFSYQDDCATLIGDAVLDEATVKVIEGYKIEGHKHDNA